MVVVFEKGQNLEYTAVRDFALNFEDRAIKSVKVKIGESVFYDGDTASYKKLNGEQVVGRCPSLKTAINVMGWLVLKVTKKGSKSKTEKEVPPVQLTRNTTGDYDGFRGGNFDTYAMRNSDGVHVAHYKKPAVIREENLIAKTTDFSTKTVNTAKHLPLDVSGDQVEVRVGFTVNSSTSVKKESKRAMPVEQRDEMGSETASTIKGIKAPVVKQKKSNSFTVDDKTPYTINEDMTKEDVEGVKASTMNQSARVVSKIAKPVMEVQDTDGVVMRKKPAVTEQEGIKLTTGVQAEKEMTVGVKVSSGSDHVASADEEGLVVGKVKTAKDVDNEANQKAKERAEARKTASKQTQAVMEKEKKSVKTESVKTDYLSQLPADWAKMHWTKKEIFVKSLTDKDFIKFIQTVETSKAIQNACSARLAELA